MSDLHISSRFSLHNPDDEDHAAMDCVTEAFAEAILAGIDPLSFARAALTTALQEFVDNQGEDAAAHLVTDLPRRIREGEFSVGVLH